jgi:uncharacterized Zn finger protein
MADAETRAKSKAIEDQLDALIPKLDQQAQLAEDEGFNVTRETTEALMATMTSLKILEQEARKIHNTRLLGRISKADLHAREALGLAAKRRHRRAG